MNIRINIPKESEIIARAITDFYFRPFNFKEPTWEQVQQLYHFAKQGVKVRLK